MKITKTYSDKFNCYFYHCTIKNEKYSSPNRDNVELWRDDKIINAEHHKELAELHDKACAEYYASKTRWDNYTGD
tara:strand:+ start:352 stop:576 length:225 start_codon:yes stop_codon:yes gene_type:complete